MKSFEHNGVHMRYDVAGEDDRVPLLLIHGMACDHTFFLPQIDHFSADRRVVSVDLPGHGQSNAPHGEYTIVGFAEACARLCDAEGLRYFVVVGHSMGGTVALELARLRPDSVAAAIVLDSTIQSDDPRRPAELTAALADLSRADWRECLHGTFAAMFLDTDDPVLKGSIIDRMLRTPRHVLASLYEEALRWDAQAAMDAFSAPLLYVQAEHRRTDLAALRASCPQLVTGQVVGSGHFLTLTVPEQVNAMMDRFLEMNGV